MQGNQLLQEVEQEEGSQGWLATFADLMSLLMCFFVLLLSFSELDVQKFKQIAGSMKYAFGVQNQINLQDIPKGTSVIAQEFSPGKPEDTPFSRIEQVTFEQQHSKMDVAAPSKQDEKHYPDKNPNDQHDNKKPATGLLAQQIANTLAEELQAGQFELDNQGQQLIIRIQENGSFASGSGFLQPRLKPALQKLSDILVDIPGKLEVSGHTDSRPLNNELFRDNLELSATRAIAVARILNEQNKLMNLSVRGMAATQPLAVNNSDANMRKNRRVEITITQGEATTSDLPSLIQQ